MLAKQLGEGKTEEMTKREHVQFAESASWQSDSKSRSVAPDRVPTVNAVKIARITRCEPQPVYNMEVETYHNFAVNGGLIVHNCIDATRYALERVFNRYANRA